MHLSFFRSNFSYGLRSRVLLVLWALFLFSGFVVAYQLEPDPRGFGTHQRLGLPPCTFQFLYQIPCPSCGMTTSFAHFVRGNFRESVQANVGGFLLAVVCAIQIPWCCVSVVQNRFWKISRPDVVLMWLLLILCSVVLLQWVIRLCLL